MGAWIEILALKKAVEVGSVAPLVGAWIEIGKTRYVMEKFGSLPLWERGLKSYKFSP